MKNILVVGRIFRENDGELVSVVTHISECCLIYKIFSSWNGIFQQDYSKGREACSTHAEFKSKYSSTNFYYESDEV